MRTVLLVACVGAASLGVAGIAQAPPSQPDTTMLELMRGIVYPSSNVVFAAQSDLSVYPQEDHPATSPNLLTSVYPGWQAVELASLAVAESTRLYLIPGRTCGNGRPVPATNADWVRFTEDTRQAGLVAHKAAQTKDQDAMVEAAGTVADACLACHRVYRDNSRDPADRCRAIPGR